MKLEKLMLILSRPLAFFLEVLFDFSTGGKNRPRFFRTKDVCPSLLYFDQNIEKIKEEFKKVYAKGELKGYEAYDPNQNYIANTVNTEKKWRVFAFNLMGAKHERNLAQCPVIARGLAQVPGYFQAMFSVLEPGKSIPPHKGRYRGYLRYHLALEVPTQNPPSIRVDQDIYTWKENESVVIDDSFEHEVINQAKEKRVVFIVDILRPLPPIMSQINYFIIHFLVKQTYAKKMEKNLRSLGELV